MDNDEPEGRDERVAAMLDVPRLDDVTRRRMVHRALAEAQPAPRARAARLLRVAAVVVGVAVVGGAAALALREEDGNREAADRAAAPTEATTNESLEAAPGDLGEISDPDVLRERLAATAAPPRATDADEPESFDEPSADSAAGGLSPACLTTLQSNGAGPPQLLSTGSYRGAPALVVVAGGTGDTAFVLDQAMCTLLTTVPLV